MNIECPACMRPAPPGWFLCATCADRLVAELLAVPGLVDEWTTTRAGLARMSAGRYGGRSAETALPVQSIARDLPEYEEQDAVGATLRGDRARQRLDNAVGTWARLVAEERGVEIPIGARGLAQLAVNGRAGRLDAPPVVEVVRWLEGAPVGPPRPRARIVRRGADTLTAPATPVEQTAVWLACHAHTLRVHALAGDALAEITGATEGIRRVIDRSERRYRGVCPHCSAELRAGLGESYVRCRGCWVQYDVAEIEAAARESAAKRLYTAGELLRVLPELGAPVAKSTLYRWIRARKLTECGWSDRGRRITDTKHNHSDAAVYRCGDALALAETAAVDSDPGV
ncbi:hypothetical protein ACFXHA_45130 [Nocardia sp. NPDC059240]|uniref:hypothetical protein n=1 Tax=Nocardia sp. NPDC059240 TaxID=3346786 RepID=UPI003693BC96